MAKAARYMRDESALDNGQAIDVGPEGDKFTITTRGFTTAYIDRLAALQRAAAIRLNTGLPPASTDRVTPDTLPPSVQDECQAQALAEKCLLDISGLENMDGSPMTIEQFKAAILKRANMGLLVLALQAAGSVGMASKALLEDAEKKLSAALCWVMMDAPLVAKYQGRAIPDTDWEALDAQSRYVAVEPWLITPWRCWNELAGERLHTQDVFGGGMGAVRGIPRPQELPYRAVQEWCDRNRLYGENREFVIACVRILDANFIRLSTIQIKQELKTIFGK